MNNWIPTYESISPHHAYLSDEVVLVQAWKKAATYVRRHNWYADHLELDLSTLSLQACIRTWSGQLTGAALLTYEPDEMRLVPAPKSTIWDIQDKWAPRDREKPARLRPLAHLSIRDQTAATAVMICLADCIETRQGNPDQDTDRARQNGVVNYGNRLFCDWQRGRASFGWGNSVTYRKYYTDYRRFLRRPTDVVTRLQARRRHRGTLAVVQLDLSGFYDRIRRDVLIGRLRGYGDAYWPEGRRSDLFWKAVRGIFHWHWSGADRSVVNTYASECLDDGLPQGLVAAGLLANAYMIEFDECVQSQLARRLPGLSWRILDYCRYVDDLRLVLACDEGCGVTSLRREVSDWTNSVLRLTSPNQNVNPDKTEVTVVGNSSTGIQVAALMTDIQTQVSGPMDAGGAEHVLQALQGLLPLAEQATTGTPPLAGIPQDSKLGPANADDGLSDLLATDMDVRPDTVERFAAHRWRSTFRHLRRMTDGAYAEGPLSPTLVAIDEKALLFAKRLVRRWMQDPSSVMLLRIAMDLYPTPNLLRTVLSLLRTHIDQVPMTPSKRVCLFVAADMLRAGAIETGYVQDEAMLPFRADAKAYHLMLSKFAADLLRETPGLPWYVTQQAMLYLATRHQSVSFAKGGAVESKRILAPYTYLHEALAPDWEPSPDKPSDAVAIAVIAHHLGGNTRRLAATLARMLGKCLPQYAAE